VILFLVVNGLRHTGAPRTFPLAPPAAENDVDFSPLAPVQESRREKVFLCVAIEEEEGGGGTKWRLMCGTIDTYFQLGSYVAVVWKREKKKKGRYIILRGSENFKWPTPNGITGGFAAVACSQRRSAVVRLRRSLVMGSLDVVGSAKSASSWEDKPLVLLMCESVQPPTSPSTKKARACRQYPSLWSVRSGEAEAQRLNVGGAALTFAENCLKIVIFFRSCFCLNLLSA